MEENTSNNESGNDVKNGTNNAEPDNDSNASYSDLKTRSLDILSKHGNDQMNENHLPGHFARNIISKVPTEIKDKLTSTQLKIETEKLSDIIKSILYGEVEISPEYETILEEMESMPVGGYGF